MSSDLTAMDSCFGLVGPRQHGTAKSRAHSSHKMKTGKLGFKKVNVISAKKVISANRYMI